MIGILLTLLLLITQGYAKENPFEYRVHTNKDYKEIRERLLEAVREGGFDPEVITISNRRPRMELIYFCPEKVPGKFQKIIAFLPCKIYILEKKEGTTAGTFRYETILSVFKRHLEPETAEFIKKFGIKVRSILREALK